MSDVDAPLRKPLVHLSSSPEPVESGEAIQGDDATSPSLPEAAWAPQHEEEARYLQTTVLSPFFPRLSPDAPLKRGALLSFEAFLYTTLAVLVPAKLGFDESGLISVFLASIPLSERLKSLLDENRDLIWNSAISKWRVNRRTAFSLLSMFLGLVLAYTLVVNFMTDARAASFFAFALDAAGVGDDTILDRHFSNIGPILGNNLMVAASIMILSLFYRYFGAMLALAWNGCLWASALSVLITRAALQEHSDPLQTKLLGILAVFPHLVVEGFAYIFVSLGAIFLSKALTKYTFQDERFAQVLKATLMMWLVGVLCLCAGAGLETLYAPFILDFITLKAP